MSTKGEKIMPGRARLGSAKFGHKLDLPKAEWESKDDVCRLYIYIYIYIFII